MSSGESIESAVSACVDRVLAGGGGRRWLLGVSGGRDSVVLLHTLFGIRARYGLELGVLHVDHGLRGMDAARDARFVIDAAGGLGLPCRVRRVDVQALANRRGKGVEEAGRWARRRAAIGCMAREGWSVWATGHHADDRREGVLLAMLRGGGLRGLAGMKEIDSRDGFRMARPLWCVDRSAIERLVTERGWAWREDATNAETIWVRNWLRGRLLPELEAAAPGTAERLLRLSARATAIEQALEDAVARETTAPADPEAARVWVRSRLGDRRVWGWSRRAWEQLIGGLLAGAPGAVAVPGGRVLFGEHGVQLRMEREQDLPQVDAWSRSWRIPGSVEIPEIGLRLTAEWAAPGRRPDLRRRAPGVRAVEELICGEALGLAPGVGLELAVRHWQEGDRMEPWGMSQGRKKLQDLFVDAKIPVGARGLIPVVAVGDRIVWVVGLRFARGLEWHEGCKAPLLLRSEEVCQAESPVVSFHLPKDDTETPEV
ncbi:MAG: tRNA lysidine(34) synthetase TilS [Verrucomicrobiota bacterium]|nr:tRNA lysidine(34) synthetase TilS [Verrucomicrobiota bacterium]